MQTNNKMITEKQLANIRKMPKEDLLLLMEECAELLGLLDIQEYMKVTGTKRRTVYDHIDKQIIKSFTIGNHKFPLINY